MEVTEENIISLSFCLEKTLNPDASTRRQAEAFLLSVEGNKNYPVLLLHLIMSPKIELTSKVAGSITFKNFIKRNWIQNEDTDSKIFDEDRETIKSLIIDAMLNSPLQIQKQLSDAIAIIGKWDFPAKWPNLIPEMVQKFNGGDFNAINGILHTAHSLFKRYRYEFKSQILWTEIKFVLDTFAKPLTDLFVNTHSLTEIHSNNPEALKVIYGSLLLISKIFYSLNFQDLPEYFEDNMGIWMPLFHTLLTVNVKSLETESGEEGLMEQIRSQVCYNVTLYATKYDEEFATYLPGFVTDIWNVLVTTNLQAKYDLLVSNALAFLSSVASKVQYKHLFEDPSVLTGICEKVIIPNIHFRDSDLEQFEDNPEEYIRRDIEGSDVETRRRAACDLVKVLGEQFEERITAIFSQYVMAMLTEYSSNPEVKWRSKNSALYLVSSLASKGQTEKQGITKINALVNLNEFCINHVLPELDRNVDTLPVLKADCLKYLISFRSILPKEILIVNLNKIINHLEANSFVVHTYAACLIEKSLIIRKNDNRLLITEEILSPLAGSLLKNLFLVLNKKGSEENEYVMKAIMRSFVTLQESVVPYLADLLPLLTQKLDQVSKNPGKPQFNHFLFETITLSIKIVCKKRPEAVEAFENALFPIFQQILLQDIQEFVPYVLQVFSCLLQLRSQLTDHYRALYPCLLLPALWERPGVIRPLSELLRAFVMKSGNYDVVKIKNLLGIFQKLIASRANDHEGFYLIQTMMEYCNREELEPFMKQVLVLVFQRLTSLKTTKFIRGALVFFGFYCITFGATNFVENVDSIQPRMFGMIIERLLIPDAQKITGDIERKITIVGLIRLICEAKSVVDGDYSNYWISIFKIIIALIELPQDENQRSDDHFIEVDDNLQDIGYQASYSRIVAADQKGYKDPLNGVTDVKLHLATSLSKLSQTCPGKIPQIINTQLSPEEKLYLTKYFDTSGVTII